MTEDALRPEAQSFRMKTVQVVKKQKKKVKTYINIRISWER